MNALDYALRFPWVEPLGRALIHFLWQGTFLGLAAWAILRRARRRSPGLRHAVAAVALVLSAVLPPGTFLLLAHPWQTAPAPHPLPAPMVPGLPAGASVPPPVGPAASSAPPAGSPVIRSMPAPPPKAATLRLAPDPALSPHLADRRAAAIRAAVVLWLAGVVVLGLRLGVGWMRVQFWRGGAAPTADADLADGFRRLAVRLGVDPPRVRLLVSRAAALPGPVAMGMFRPVVLIPARILERLPLAQIEALLAHELAHIRRHDYLWNLLASTLEVALFYHPAVWFLGRELRAAREECCDALAAGVCPDRVAYVRALAAVAEGHAPGAALGVPAPAAARFPLATRVRRLLGLDVPPEPLFTHRNAGWALALAAVAFASASILYSGRLMAQNEAEDPTVPVLDRPAPHGSVLDAGGRAVPGARVRLVQIHDEWSLDNGVAEETTTDAGGRFALAGPVRFHHPDAYRNTAEYTLLADAPDLAPGWLALSPDDAPDTDRRLTLTAPTHKDFLVLDRSGQPVEGAVAEMRGAYPREGDHGGVPKDKLFLPEGLGLRRGVTDRAGRVTVEGLPDTMIHFAISKAGFGDNTNYQSRLADEPQTVALQVASTLEGRVTDPLGRPVAGATVSLYPKFRFHTFFPAKTDADGRYRIEKIWSDRAANANWKDWGRYEVSVRHPRFTAAAREVAFEGRQAVTHFDFAAVPGTELAGHLRDPQTLGPVADAAVQVDSSSGRQSFLTGTDGSFHGRIMPGEIDAFFWQAPRNRFVVDGHAEGLPTNLRVHADGERFAADVYTPGPVGRLGTVRGQVKAADGSPAARCQVTASTAGYLQIGGWRNRGPRAVSTDAAGAFTIGGFPIGPAFTLDARTTDNTATGTLAVTLEAGALDLATPLVLQPTTPGGEFLLTDRHGQPHRDFSVNVGVIRDDQSYPAQSDGLKSDGDGVLRVPHTVPGAHYAVTHVGSDGVTEVVNTFDAPAAGDPLPARRTLVIDPEGAVRLLGSDGAPLPIKRFVEFAGTGIIYGHRSRWENDLPVLRREGADAVIPWKKVAGNRGGAADFLVETDDGNYVRAAGPIPLDGSNLFVIRATAVMRPDFVPDPTIADAAAGVLTGRVVTPEGEPVAGAVIDLPGVHFQDEKVPPILSGADGVFRVAQPPYRFTHLSIAREGWATAFVTDVQAGQGFRVTLRRDTSLRGTIGGENPGRVALVLKTNKFTRNEQSYNHEVQDVSLRRTTDEHGAYDFPVEPGRYRWEASSVDGRFARGEVSVEPGKAADLGAALHRGYDLTFDLVDCQSGQPVPGIEVAIYEQRADRVYSPREGSALTSDAAGRIHWENLPAGPKQFVCNRLQRGQLAAGHEQYPYSRWWRADEPHEWERVDYAKRAPTGQDHTSWIGLDVTPDLPPVRIYLERGVKISGRVVGANGEGVPDARLQAIAQPGITLSNNGAQTDKAGNFLAYLPAGNGLAYRLCAYTFPDPGETAPGAPSVSESFTSRPGDERTFQLVMGKGGWFTGRLMTADGQPAAGGKMTAVAGDGLEVSFAARIAKVGADGRFRLGPLRPGRYKVYPGTGGGAPIREVPGARETEAEVTAEGETRDLGDLALPAGAKLADG